MFEAFFRFFLSFHFEAGGLGWHSQTLLRLSYEQNQNSDIRHNDIQHNDTQTKGDICDIQQI